jgi:DNA-binding transcriptional regulator YdaS (Cro superfamily)
MPKHPINKEWFFKALEANQKSVRGLARHLDVDPSAVSRMLSGHRKMKADEAGSIARFLSVPVTEVMKHAGAPAGAPEIMLSRIKLTGTINEAGRMESLGEERSLPQSVLAQAQAAIAGLEGVIMAAQIRASTGPLAILDDALVLFKASKNVENAAIGSIAICRTADGADLMAKVERARKTGEARVIDITGAEIDIDLRSAAPVIAILP